LHGSTFGGNPLACAAALATLDEIEERRLPERAATVGALLRARLDQITRAAPLVREARGLGLMQGLELRVRAQPYLEALAERGVLAQPAGPYVIRLLPPLVIEPEQIERVADALGDTLQEVA
jgi:acetylornithine/LysW-gamma-L-lysine aminotransferase